MYAQTNSPLTLHLLNLCQGHTLEVSRLIHALQEKSIECKESPTDVLKTQLLLFDDFPKDVEWKEALIDAISHGCYVLAVSMNKTKLPFYQIWDLLGLGVQDVYSFAEIPRLADILTTRLQRQRIIAEIIQSNHVKKVAIGNSPKWTRLLQQVVEVAVFSKSSVVLLGESGTGKELIARLIHDLDRRLDKRELVILDCSTLVTELSGSEFFGHEKGSFTNAFSMREGAFGLADGGTLFLDEVGELPLLLQAALLRVIQEGTYKRVGSNQWRKTNFRLICATNRNLEQEVEKGRFREDLYYRITSNVYTLPPLRERKEDILILADYFLQEALKLDYSPTLDNYLQSFLLTHLYPGNVRELRQLIQRLAIRYPGAGPLTLGCLSSSDRDLLPNPNSWQETVFQNAIRMALANGVLLRDIKRIAAETALDIAIEESNSNLQVVAKRLDTSDRLVQLHQANRRK